MHIGIVGAGNVGVGVADALAYLGIGKRVTLYNRHIERALGEVWDLNDSIPLLTGDMIFHATDDFEALRSCEVIVITVGAKQKTGRDTARSTQCKLSNHQRDHTSARCGQSNCKNHYGDQSGRCLDPSRNHTFKKRTEADIWERYRFGYDPFAGSDR